MGYIVRTFLCHYRVPIAKHIGSNMSVYIERDYSLNRFNI